ncbi:MAG TPA: sulfatase [bacterium]|nr:sulfatase [bacterium]
MPDRPHVILIVLDATRADHLSCYGYSRATTPNLDAFASRATRYTNAWAGSTWTLPSIATLFTGVWPGKHGANRRHPFLDTTLPTLAELLSAAGYDTYGVSNNSWISSATGFARGFRRFDKVWQLFQDGTDVLSDRMVGVFSNDQFGAKDLAKSVARGNPVKNLLNTFYGRVLYKRGDSGAAKVNRLVNGWLKQRAGSAPAGIFLHYLEPHLPFHPPQPWKSRFLPSGVSPRKVEQVNLDAWAYLAGHAEMTEEDFEIFVALYDAEISYLDHRLGELFSMLDDHRLLDDSQVVVTADHGENLGEHGLLDHQYSVHEPLLNVPLLVKEPGAEAEAGRVNPALVQSFDAFATLLRTARAEDPAAGERDAIPFPSAGGRARTHLFAEYLQPQPDPKVLEARFPGFDASPWDRALSTARNERFKYVLSSRGEEELYDLQLDPGERANVIQEHPPVAEELRAALRKRFGEDGPREGGDGDGLESLDGELRKRLEALGYLA